MDKQAKRLIRGRPPVADGEVTISCSIRMTKAQRGKLRRLGGARWIRKMIDLSPECASP